MKKLTFLVAICFFSIPALAQTPPNDDCNAPVNLGPAPVCTSDIYTTKNATASFIGANNAPSCLPVAPQRDVWFTFICPSNILSFRINLTGTGSTPLKSPAIVVYRGDCSPDGLAELDCVAAPPGATSLFLDVEALTPGALYFIRVTDNSPLPDFSGDFNLCVDEIPPVLTIDQGGSTLCTGTLYDTGGPDANYGNNEDHTFTICPNQPASCIEFTLDYFYLDAGSFPGANGADMLTFYDGPDISAPVLAQFNGNAANAGTVGGGGVCFRMQAHSGCLTVAFHSNGIFNYKGFKGHWKCSDKDCSVPVPLEVETNVVPADIVNAVVAPGTSVAITDINCTYGAYGTFSLPSDPNNLGLTKGLVLSSGDARLIADPNSISTITTLLGAPGDANLDYLSGIFGSGSKSFDACVVEMDVFVATDELTFEYVFGSEEYPEYVGQPFNDIFAFLVSGPGITGDPNLGGAKNIAVLPGTNTPVQINSVNHLTNWEYYRNNGVFNGSTLSYDGFTADYLGIKKSLTARVDAIPCNTYHLKLALADRGDEALDSGVFISEVRGGAPDLSVEFASGIDYLIENCTGNLDQLAIRLRQPKSVAASYTITIGGTAENGVDYILNIPPLITFQPGDTVLFFPILPLSDMIPEGTETITITISKDFGCGTVAFETISIDLKDDAEVRINNGADTLFVCAGGTLQLEAAGALSYFWEPPGVFTDPNIPNPAIAPAQAMWIKVTGSIGACVDQDSVFIQVVNTPVLEIQAAGPTAICQGDTLQLSVLSNAGASGIQWTPKSRLSDPGSPSPLVYPLSSTTYTATLTLPGCPSASDQISILVDTLFALTPGVTDTTVCQNYPVALGQSLVSTSHYAWTPAAGLSDPNAPNPLATPDQTTTYTLTTTSANGYCSQTTTSTVQVIPADIEIEGDANIDICLGDTLPLTAKESPAGAVINWSPSFYVAPATGPVVVTAPDESVTVQASYLINGCLVRDSVHIRVDSLPLLDIALDPVKPVYCPGDTVYLLSKTYEPANFPGMAHAWDNFPGELTPVKNWNMVILATTTHTFQRITSNHACVDTADVLVPVGVPPTITVTANPSEICPGQSVQINATVTPGQRVEWEDITGTLSCPDCLTPTATPAITTTYSLKAPEAECPGGASITVTVLPLPALDLSAKTICLGNTVVINNIPTNPADTYTWTASPPGSILDPGSAAPTVNPTVTSTYSVVATGKCNNQGSVTVTVNSAAIEAGADQTVCPNTPVVLTAKVSGSPGTVAWSPGNLSGNPLTVTPDNTTTYTAIYSFDPNCQVSDTVAVFVLPGVTLSGIQADSVREIICEGEMLRLKVTVTPPGTMLTWLENGTPIPGATKDSIVVSPAGAHGDVPVPVEYTVTATDANGCTAAAGPFRQLIERCFAFPNAFTPGNDDVNETFPGILVYGGHLEVVEFRVFNRWGQQVFEATANQKAWDGKIDGKDAPVDVYAWFATVRFADGSAQTFKGEVSLLR